MKNNFLKVLVVGSGLSAYGACLGLLDKDNVDIDGGDLEVEWQEWNGEQK